MSLIQLKLDDMRGQTPSISPACGCFIAGGAVRRWFNGKEELSDIDVFSPSVEKQQEYLASIIKTGAKLIYETKNADTYDLNGVHIQLIKIYHPTAQALVDSFDFNVCQFVWDETGIWATQEAIIGVLRGHLAVNKILRNFATDSLRRAFKYQLKGFIPCAGTIRDLATSFVEMTDEEIKAQIEMSPKGGSRIIRFD